MQYGIESDFSVEYCKSAKVEIRLGGPPILATIDTAAEVTVVDKHLLDRLKIKGSSQRVSLRQADGSQYDGSQSF